MRTLNEIKQQVAEYYCCKNFNEMIDYTERRYMGSPSVSEIVDKVADLYETEVYNQALKDAAEAIAKESMHDDEAEVLMDAIYDLKKK